MSIAPKAFQPPSPANANWTATLRDAAAATDANFVALAGYEHSENNGPGGKGHINVINSAGYLNAMAPGVDLPANLRVSRHGAKRHKKSKAALGSRLWPMASHPQEVPRA